MINSDHLLTPIDNYEYLMKLQISTPPFCTISDLYTGSDIIWTQCLPCLNCFNQSNPIIDPSKSLTYKEKQCNTPNDPSCDYKLI
ncbi:unnamed protein product [Brassica napus]|uniref:(rape) hypothetical protein n=1 Tax=Brassica napus TaxID=3708 RepID=A0A816JNV1_BRANA|nr:unnamed protein product [Brassica napus]